MVSVGKSTKNALAAFSVIVVLIANAIFLSINTFRGFNFYDEGSFLDVAWRIYTGQRPYIDFIYHSGPVHLYMELFFFRLFGFGKTAIVAHLITVHSIVIVLTYAMTRKYAPRWCSLISALLAATSFYWPVSFPWRDQSAHLWGLFAVAAVYFFLPFKKSRPAFLSALFGGFFTLLSIMTKTNIGMAYALVIPAVLLFSGKRRITYPAFFAGFVLGVCANLLLIPDLHRFIEQVSEYNGEVLHIRLAKLFSIRGWTLNYYWIIVAVAAIGMLGHLTLLRKQPLRQNFLLLLGIFFVGIISVQFGGMFVPSNIFLWGTTVSLAYTVLYIIKSLCRPRRHRLWHRLPVILLTMVAFFLMVKSTRYGLQLLTWTYTKRTAIGNYSIKAKLLEGWRSDEKEGKALDALAEYIQQNIPEKEPLLILADMQVLYPITKRESYRGITFNFYVGTFGYFPVPGKQQQEVTATILKNPPGWIITQDPRLRYNMPLIFTADLIRYLRLTKFIDTQYETVKEISPYLILKRKTEPEWEGRMLLGSIMVEPGAKEFLLT